MFRLISSLGRIAKPLPCAYRQRHKKSCPVPGTSHKPKEGGYKVYKLLTFLVGFPAILGALVNVYLRKTAREGECRPPFIKYEYLRLRSKRFPWGDGSRSLFHNPHINPLPNGYEKIDD